MGTQPSKDAATSSSNANPSAGAWQGDQTVDYGVLLAHGIYQGTPQDYDQRVVRKLIFERRLAPFYKGLADEPVIEDIPEEESTTPSPTHTDTLLPAPSVGHKKPDSFGKSRERSSSNSSVYSSMSTENAKMKKLEAERRRLFVEKKLYKDAIECPICFLYYPSNINHSRCCAQPICSECFIQIKRPPEAPSTPASCPFCVEPNFGVYYKPPEWSEKSLEKRTVILSGSTPSIVPTASSSTASITQKEVVAAKVGNPEKVRRKTLSHQDPEVVTIDMVRPDWNRLLDVPRSRPGSRRNSIGSSSGSSRRIVVRPNSSNTTSSRGNRSSTSAAAAEYGSYLAAMRTMNMDLEELMVMEAVRLSLLEQEEAQRRERESAENPAAEGNPNDTSDTTTGTSSDVASQASDDLAEASIITDAMDTTEQTPPIITIGSDDSNSDDDEPLVRGGRAHLFPRANISEDDDGASTSNPPPFPPRLSSEQNVPTTPPPPHEDGGSSASNDVKAPIVVTDDEQGDRNEGTTDGSQVVY